MMQTAQPNGGPGDGAISVLGLVLPKGEPVKKPDCSIAFIRGGQIVDHVVPVGHRFPVEVTFDAPGTLSRGGSEYLCSEVFPTASPIRRFIAMVRSGSGAVNSYVVEIAPHSNRASATPLGSPATKCIHFDLKNEVLTAQVLNWLQGKHPPKLMNLADQSADAFNPADKIRDQNLLSGGRFYLVRSIQSAARYGVICGVSFDAACQGPRCGFVWNKLSVSDASNVVARVQSFLSQLGPSDGSPPSNWKAALAELAVSASQTGGTFFVRGDFHTLNHPDLRPVVLAIPFIENLPNIRLVGGATYLPSYRPPVIGDILQRVSRVGFEFLDRAPSTSDGVRIEAVLFGCCFLTRRWSVRFIPALEPPDGKTDPVRNAHVDIPISNESLTTGRIVHLLRLLNKDGRFPVDPAVSLRSAGFEVIGEPIWTQIPESPTPGKMLALIQLRTLYRLLKDMPGISVDKRLDVGRLFSHGPDTFGIAPELSGSADRTNERICFTVGAGGLIDVSLPDYSADGGAAQVIAVPALPTMREQVLAIIKSVTDRRR
jgi:hypothetical protein